VSFRDCCSSLDKFATEIRNLQRPEIDELSEPFQTGKQVGSSAMPQKRNPWRSENISSLAKIERSLPNHRWKLLLLGTRGTSASQLRNGL